MSKQTLAVPSIIAVAVLAFGVAGCSTEGETVPTATEPSTSRMTVTSTRAKSPDEIAYDKWEAAYATYSGSMQSSQKRSAYGYHQEACETLRNGGTEGTELNPGQSPAQYLHDGWGVGNDDWNGERIKPEVLEVVIVPVLCPEQAQVVEDAKAGNFEIQFPTAFINGKYLVGERIQPGTYSIQEPVSDCYWERSDSQGNIIDNNFISIAPSVTVTILESDAGFTSQNCGRWIMDGS